MGDAGTDAPRRSDAGSDAGPPEPSRPAPRPLTQWVDPTIGSGGTGFTSIGSVHPGPQTPFGMVRPGPDTGTLTSGGVGFLHCSGYSAFDDYVRAFSAWRLHGIGINDGGGASIMPVPSFETSFTEENGWVATKGAETAELGYYAVDVTAIGETSATHVEVTATDRVGLYRITYAGDASEPTILVPLVHAHPGVEVMDASISVDATTREVEGHARLVGGYSGRFGGVTIHYVVRFDTAPVRAGTFVPGTIDDATDARTGSDAGAFVTFAPGATTVTAAVSFSYIDAAHARAAIDRETPDLDFDATRTALTALWETTLGAIEVDARTDRDFTLFYTSLYHSLLMPSLATEIDGAGVASYRGFDGEIHALPTGPDAFTYYTDFSLWDTYRTLHPLVDELFPDLARDFVRSLMAMAEDDGTYPRWPLGTGETRGMLGEPAAIAIADAWVRGMHDFDVAHALDLFDATAFTDPADGGRGGVEPYVRLGYVPVEAGGDVTARTLEFAWADYALGVLAEAADRPDEATSFGTRGRSFENTFDPAQGFFVGRHEDGSFLPLEDEFAWEDVYAEGNAWQYLWLGPQDADALATTLGGRETALERLAQFFDESSREPITIAAPHWYWHGNEPDIHAPFLFSLWGDPDSSARWSAWARERHYDDAPDGLPGNDDSGTMSAWYVFSALGLYPIAGTDRWAIASPGVTRAVVHRDAGDWTITAPNAAPGSVYVQMLSIDGTTHTTPSERATLEESDLTDGITLDFDLDYTPAP